MSLLQRLPRKRHRTTPLLLAAAAIAVALVGVAGCRPPTAASAQAPLVIAPPASEPSLDGPLDAASRRPTGTPAADRSGALGVEDGRVPDDATVLDSAFPAVANLDPHLRAALRTAARDAAREGITFHLNSGWRSTAYQEQLLDEAVATYGSRAEAARWVATPATSAHVSGDAVDLADPDAMTWLAENGARYGLCQTYVNEPWHYEVRPHTAERGCPAGYTDPSQDPRMRR